MKDKRISSIPIAQMSSLQVHLTTYPHLMDIVRDLAQRGAGPLLVGGAVRDMVLERPVKDIDIEVHRIDLDDLKKVLAVYGPVSLVGAAYGVLRLHGIDVDWSVPRTEGAGRKPAVQFHELSLHDAFARRDLTMNALAIDLVSWQLIDLFGGLEDIQARVLRAVDVTRFAEDPLRFYRVMQFIGRFDMLPDEALDQVCATMDISAVSIERIEQEYAKLFLTAHTPSRSFSWLHRIGRASLYPELFTLASVPQNPDYHPEGDVFEHTMQTIDAAAQLTYASAQEKLLIMYASLCHDLGKATTTDMGPPITSKGHQAAGVALTTQLLERIVCSKSFIDRVCLLVRYHMMPGQLQESNDAAYKRLARKLFPVTLFQLGMLALADKRARNERRGAPLSGSVKVVDLFLKKAQYAGVLAGIEQPILQGRDLLAVIPPGPELGQLLDAAYEIQLEQGITDKEMLKKMVLSKKRS